MTNSWSFMSIIWQIHALVKYNQMYDQSYTVSDQCYNLVSSMTKFSTNCVLVYWISTHVYIEKHIWPNVWPRSDLLTIVCTELWRTHLSKSEYDQIYNQNPFGQMYSHKHIYSHVRNPKLLLARCYHIVLLTACVRAHFTHHLHAWPATLTIKLMYHTYIISR